MACSEFDSSLESAARLSFEDSCNMGIEESSLATPADLLAAPEVPTTSVSHNSNIPKPPPPPAVLSSGSKFSKRVPRFSNVPKEIKDMWNRLFEEGYKADVKILTDDVASTISAHSFVLGIASPVLKNILEDAIVKGGFQYIKIPGVPFEAVSAFIRFLYSSSYDQEGMKKFVLHLLVLSHIFSVPSLKKVCINFIEQAFLTTENVIDVLQLARQCDAPRLSLFCVRLVVKNFKTVSRTEGWKVMKKADPMLEQELLESLVEADSREQEKLKKLEEKKIYLQLYDAMEALLHICKDGCRTIGPRDKMLKVSQVPCGYSACKGLELLVRHFSSCKTRVPGGCVHCKRMWQLLELHSRMCSEPDSCKVPLCRHFKEKMKTQSRKDEEKWKLLVSKVMTANRAVGLFASWKNVAKS
ncbi:hypothetical protein AAC387_Pa05g0534 [Persea americana]|eukprot:TRINITY_DN2251_c1_g1_i2.p1 TRINITY_DN2251_c1_g1~~TRINITY_DN2251_c1_g1_i2.p1  ORF type:complete len:413 (-),score=95.06 TRINITY_DN2251_c1_g1_i2:830-2068(-)